MKSAIREALIENRRLDRVAGASLATGSAPELPAAPLAVRLRPAPPAISLQPRRTARFATGNAFAVLVCAPGAVTCNAPPPPAWATARTSAARCRGRKLPNRLKSVVIVAAGRRERRG